MTKNKNRPHIPVGADEFRASHELRAEDDGNRLVGYAAVFDQDTVINSWEGHFIERISRGAFKRTLKNRAAKVKVLFNHGQDPSIGDMPLGKPEVMREDGHGFYTETPLSDTDYNKLRIKPLLADGALDGMSFRFTVPQGGDEWSEDEGELPVRTINELRLYEFGPVVFPAYDGATAGLRSDPRMETLRNQLHPEDHDNPDQTVMVIDNGGPAAGTSPADPHLEHSARLTQESHDLVAHWRSKAELIAARTEQTQRRAIRG